MEKKNKQLQTTSQYINVFLAIASVAVTVLGLWLTVKLAPLSESISTIATRVEAIENNQVYFVNKDTYNSDIKGIQKSLETIDKNMGYLINLHLTNNTGK